MESLPVKFGAQPPAQIPPQEFRFAAEDPRESLTLAQVVEIYFRHPHRLDPVTFENRQRAVYDFIAIHGQTLVKNARRYDLLQWAEAHPSWESPWTRRRAIGDVKAVFGWAYKLDIIKTNPFAGISSPRGERGRAIERDEFQTLLRHSSPLFRRCLIFLRYTGCRPGEMTAAKWTDLDLRRACISLRQHKTAERTGVPRQIILHPVILKLIAWIRRNNPHPKFIFANKIGKQWRKNTLYCRIAQLRQECSIPSDVTLYSIRHGFAVEAVMSGIDTLTLMPLLGHTDIGSTAYYARMAGRTDHLQDALGNIFHKPEKRGKS